MNFLVTQSIRKDLRKKDIECKSLGSHKINVSCPDHNKFTVTCKGLYQCCIYKKDTKKYTLSAKKEKPRNVKYMDEKIYFTMIGDNDFYLN